VRRFDTLLIANRGEIARRIMRSATDTGLRTVAVFVTADEHSMFVEEADDAIRIDSYLDANSIIAAALVSGAGAIHPGYGFLAENANFATAVSGKGLTWIGPSADVISAMGDKIEAKKLALEAGVPVLSSVDDEENFASLGFPLLIKAAAGGGGKGMRVVESPDDLQEAVQAARREALAGFGDDKVFAENYVPRARHIEIQILGDSHGNMVHLGERECSIQRRHQKVIEESPSPFLSAEMRQAMGDAAVRLGSAISYESAGTVEFLVDTDTGAFFFLEVNTRLQVEHPVTEEVTGIDLVREQLRVAHGEPLGYGQDDVSFAGHAIEARLYAEDPDNDFLPATGTLDVFEAAQEPNVRWDTGVRSGSVISVDFDPMIAKVVSRAATRTDAAGQLALALERLQLGGVVTNRDFLAAVLRTDEFLDGDTTTDFIERVNPARVRPVDAGEIHRVTVAAAMWLQGSNRQQALTLANLPSGFRVGRLASERSDFVVNEQPITVHYTPRRGGGYLIGNHGDGGTAHVHLWSSDRLDVEVDGWRRVYAVAHARDKLYMTAGGGTTTVTVMPRFAVPEPEIPGGAVSAPMPGKVIDLRVDVGDVVEAGQVLAVLEAMKMENHLRAPNSGSIIELRVAVGDQVEKDTLLLVIDDATVIGDNAPSDPVVR